MRNEGGRAAFLQSPHDMNLRQTNQAEMQRLMLLGTCEHLRAYALYVSSAA